MKNRIFFSNFPDCSQYKSFKNDFYPLLNRSIFTFTGPLFKGITCSKRSPALGSAQLCSRCQVSSPTISDPTLLHSTLPPPLSPAAGTWQLYQDPSYQWPHLLRPDRDSKSLSTERSVLWGSRLLANVRTAQTSTFSWVGTNYINSVSEEIALTCIAVESIPFSHANDSSHDIHPSYWMAVVNIYT